MFLKKIRLFILDLLFPLECLGCSQPDAWLCSDCFKKISLNQDNYYKKIKSEPSFLDGFFVGAEWENKLLQELIHKFKYNFAQELAPTLGQILNIKMARVLSLEPELKNLILMPVPLHKKRLAWRGFNQAELLAQNLSKEFNLPIEINLIKRIKNTAPQVKLSAIERAKNIKAAFALNKNMPTDFFRQKIFILIDDVITTGSTMNEVAKVLKQAGANKVYGLAVARG